MIGENIRKIRALRGYSEDYMAQELEISQRQYSRYETGDTDLTLTKLEEICKVLDVPVGELLQFSEKVLFQQCEQAHAFGRNNTYNGNANKERELYEARIKQLEEEVGFLRSLIQQERKA